MRSFVRATLVALMATALAGTSAQAQAALPQLAGTWVLDTQKSTSGPAVPAKLTMEIKQQPTSIEVHRIAEVPNGTSDATLRYNTDGSPSPNQIKQGAMQFEAVSVASWSGAMLKIDTKIKAGEQEVLQSESWSLSADAKTLTIDRILKTEGEELKATLVLQRK